MIHTEVDVSPAQTGKHLFKETLQVLAGISTPKLHLQQLPATCSLYLQILADKCSADLDLQPLTKKTKNLWPPPEGSGRTQHNKPPITASASEPA